MTDQLDIVKVRGQFPSLAGQQVYMNNAGGSQVPKSVIDSIAAFLSFTNAQLTSPYPMSEHSTSLFLAGHDAGAQYINATSSEVVFGTSTTQLLRNLSTALKVERGQEVVISALEHEADIAPWVQIAKWKGLDVKWWIPTENTTTNPQLVVENIEKLVNEKTRLVCCTHTSNVLGTITDVASLSKAIKKKNPKTLFCVDGVAYAPHGSIDVKSLGIDFYAMSWYKAYGPHMAMLYVKEAAKTELEQLGHYFLNSGTLRDMLGLSAASYEVVQSVTKIVEYIGTVGWEAIAKQEQELQKVLLDYLRSNPDLIRIYGTSLSDRRVRVPVISFRVEGRSSKSIVAAIGARSPYGCHYGHAYAKRLCDMVLRLADVDDGVIRVSFLHYNTVEEVKGLVCVLDEVIKEGVGQVTR